MPSQDRRAGGQRYRPSVRRCPLRRVGAQSASFSRRRHKAAMPCRIPGSTARLADRTDRAWRTGDFNARRRGHCQGDPQRAQGRRDQNSRDQTGRPGAPGRAPRVHCRRRIGGAGLRHRHPAGPPKVFPRSRPCARKLPGPHFKNFDALTAARYLRRKSMPSNPPGATADHSGNPADRSRHRE
jgi:hypothetical protein